MIFQKNQVLPSTRFIRLIDDVWHTGSTRRLFILSQPLPRFARLLRITHKFP